MDINQKISMLTNTPLVGTLYELTSIMEALRDKDKGCPWDKEQDHMSLRSYMIEEAYEAVEAIESKDDKELIGELGDVLLQVVFHCQLAKERDAFTIEDVIKNISEKMIRRHPHVFSTDTVTDSTEVLKNWEIIKKQENKDKGSNKKSFADSIAKLPSSMPSLLRAERIGEKSARVQFDWNEINDVVSKVEEEITEIKEALNSAFEKDKIISMPLSNQEVTNNHNPIKDIGSEIGDSIFSLVQLARWLGLSAENLTRECCNRFLERLKVIEDIYHKDLSELDMHEKSAMWKKAKEYLKKLHED